MRRRDLIGALAGGAAFVGHIFPVWLRFRGGKGVATFFGTLLAIAWPVGMLAGATWIAMAALFRMSSLAALELARRLLERDRLAARRRRIGKYVVLLHGGRAFAVRADHGRLEIDEARRVAYRRRRMERAAVPGESPADAS